MAREGDDVPPTSEADQSQRPTKKNSGALKIHGMRSAEIFAKDPRKTRCRRTDGRRWRCSRDIAGPDERYCSAHLIRMRPERARARSHHSGLGEHSAEGIIQRLVAAGACPLQGQAIGADQFALLQRLVADNGAQRSHDPSMRDPNDPFGVVEPTMQRQLFHPSGEEIVRFPVTRFHRHSTNCREDLDAEAIEDSVWRNSMYNNSSDNAATTLHKASMENFNVCTTFGRTKTEGSFDARTTTSEGWDTPEATHAYLPLTAAARQLSNPECRQVGGASLPTSGAEDVRRFQSLPALQVYHVAGGPHVPSPLAPQRAPPSMLAPQPQVSQDGSSSTVSTSTSRMRFSHDGEVSGRPMRHHHPYATFGASKVGLHTFSSFPLERAAGRGLGAVGAGPPDASLEWASTLDTEGMYTLLTQHSQANRHTSGMASGVHDTGLGPMCVSVGAGVAGSACGMQGLDMSGGGAEGGITAGVMAGLEAALDGSSQHTGMPQQLMSMGLLAGPEDLGHHMPAGYAAGMLARMQQSTNLGMQSVGGAAPARMGSTVSQGSLHSMGEPSLFVQGSMGMPQGSLRGQPSSFSHQTMLSSQLGGNVQMVGMQGPQGQLAASLTPATSTVSSSGSFLGGDRQVGQMPQQGVSGMAGLSRMGGELPLGVYDMLRGYAAGGLSASSPMASAGDTMVAASAGKLQARDGAGGVWGHSLQGGDNEAAMYGMRGQEVPRGLYGYQSGVAKEKMVMMQQALGAADVGGVAAGPLQSYAYNMPEARDMVGHPMARPELQSLMQAASYN
eukprot:jgi/Mesvir1/16818/Mv15179-RA.1